MSYGCIITKNFCGLVYFLICFILLLLDGTVKQWPEVYINVSTPFISGDIVAIILDTPFADLVVDNYVNTSVSHSIEEVPVTGGRDIFVSENSYLDVLIGLVYLHVHSCELAETLLLSQSAHQQFLASVLLSKVLTLYYNFPLTVRN
jgi:hypothetical protein